MNKFLWTLATRGCFLITLFLFLMLLLLWWYVLVYIFSLVVFHIMSCWFWWKYACAQRKNNRSTSFVIDNMCFVNFRIWKQESVPWCDEFQNKDCKHLGILLIFTTIPLTPKICSFSISNVNLFKREFESVQHLYTPFHASC